jgi:hypothetical protein
MPETALIPPKMAEAFGNAVRSYLDWSYAQPEPEVSLDRQSVTITGMCGLVMSFHDQMPDWILPLLHNETHGDIDTSDLKNDNSYERGGQHLLKLINYKKRLHHLRQQ